MTRIRVRRGLAVIVACLLLVTIGSRPGYPQPNVAKDSGLIEIPRPPEIHVGPVAPAPPPTVDQLIVTLEDLKRQREALEKKEKAVAEQLKERLKDQQERLAKLGLNPPKPGLVPKVEVPDVDLIPPPVAPVAPK